MIREYHPDAFKQIEIYTQEASENSHNLDIGLFNSKLDSDTEGGAAYSHERDEGGAKPSSPSSKGVMLI